MKVIENKRSLKVIPASHEKKVGMELQQMESAETFAEYQSIPRQWWAKVHRLSGECAKYHAVGITPSHRMVFEVLGAKNKEEIKMRKYSIDYHKEKKSC